MNITSVFIRKQILMHRILKWVPPDPPCISWFLWLCAFSWLHALRWFNLLITDKRSKRSKKSAGSVYNLILILMTAWTSPPTYDPPPKQNLPTAKIWSCFITSSRYLMNSAGFNNIFKSSRFVFEATPPSTSWPKGPHEKFSEISWSENTRYLNWHNWQ